MKIDRARAQKAFADYAAHYNAADAKVKLKIDHTYRVAALCARIAQSLALPPEDVDLAWLSGILHDVGRFEQLRRYNTFIDAQSVSHAALSVAVLFDDGRIRDYLDDAGADALLRTAVCATPTRSTFCGSTSRHRWRKFTTSALRRCAGAR